MSNTPSSPTRTLTATADSESTESPLVADRWTNNITYRQLVVSSCISILQLWWHPYVYDLKRLVPFLFLYNVFSIIIGYPMFYLELAIGVVTRKGVINSWDLAPFARGVGFAMLVTCTSTALATSVVGAWALAQLVHTCHAFLPWLHCAAAARPACAARQRALGASDVPPQSFFFNFVLSLNREESSALGDLVAELAVYFLIVWLLVYFVAIKKIYSYSKLVMFKDVLAYFVLVCCGVGCLSLDGAERIFSACDWTVLFEGTKMWREAIEYCLLEMAVSQGTLVMLGSYCPRQQAKLSHTALFSFVASKTCCMGSALILGATHGALQADYATERTNIWPGSAAPMVLWADFVARVPGSQFWAALVFFTLFVLSVAFVALLVQTIMSTFTGRSIRRIKWAFLIVICCLFFVIGVITMCTSSGLYVVNFLMRWAVPRPRTVTAAVAPAAVTVVYGQTTFCEDVYFAVGEYPGLFVRVCWAVAPFILTAAFLMGASEQVDSTSMVGLAAVTLTLLPILVVSVIYSIFKCRVRNIIRNEK